MAEYIRCTKCPADWVVSTEDPDSTLSEAMDHIHAAHGAGTQSIATQATYLDHGVNRCRDDAHSTPHKGCFLR